MFTNNNNISYFQDVRDEKVQRHAKWQLPNTVTWLGENAQILNIYTFLKTIFMEKIK